MDLSFLHLPGLGIPVVGATGYFAYGRWQSRMLDEKRALVQELEERRTLQESHVILRTEFERWVKTEAQGGVPMVLGGTGGTSLGQKEACEACRGSAEDSYDYQLLAEPNNDSRRRYLEVVAQLPRWREKIIEEEFPRLPGFQRRTPSEVLDPNFLPYWEPDLRRTAREQWLPAIRLHDKPRYLKVKLSTGGSGVAPLVAIEEFNKDHPGIPVYVEMVLDEADDCRTTNIPELLDRYSQVTQGICLLDNRRQPQLFDQAQALLGPATITAPWIDARAPEDFNVWGDIHRHHLFSTIRASFKMVKVESRKAWRDKLPPLYYTPTSRLEFALIQAILEVLTDPTTQSGPLQEAEPRFIYVIAPIRPEPDLSAVARRVEDALRPHLGFNTKLAFASIGKPLGPRTREVPIGVVSVFPLEADLRAVRNYVTGKKPVDPRFLTQPSITTIGGNGHAGLAQPTADLAPARAG